MKSKLGTAIGKKAGDAFNYMKKKYKENDQEKKRRRSRAGVIEKRNMMKKRPNPSTSISSEDVKRIQAAVPRKYADPRLR